MVLWFRTLAPQWQPTVPTDCYHRARRFWRELNTTDAQFKIELDSILAPVAERYKTARNPRREQLLGFRREWEQLPSFGRLGIKSKATRHADNCPLPKRGISCGDMKYSRWTEGPKEITFGVELFTFTADKKRWTMIAECLATFSLHAIARRIERGRDTSYQAIIADLTTLVAAYDYIMAAPYPAMTFEVPTADGGRWIGECVSADFVDGRPQRKVMAVRTYLGPDH